MKKLRSALSLFIPVFILFITGASIHAASSDIQKLYDNGGILTGSEQSEIESLCDEYSQKADADIIILTENGIDTNRKTFIEDFYDSNDTVLTDSIILLINMDPDNRGVEVQGYGQAEFNLSDSRLEKILDDITPMLKDGNYYDAMKEYVLKAEHYMNSGPDTDYQHTEQDNANYNENYYEDSQKAKKINIPVLLLISAAIGGITVGVMAYRSGGKMTVSQGTYLSEGNSRILARHDRYIRTSTTKTKRPDPSSGSSGSSGGGGVSSGGSSHSGAGRSF